jgi:predicted house-cleaning noncanonical NTP pyrophosphatase (MazG superfamily)
MPSFKFDKLVRDKIVEHQLTSGAKPSYRKLDSDDHKKELINKIIEEANEILKAEASEVAAEIADVQQAVDDLIIKYGLTKAEVKHKQKIKNQRNGSFSRGLYVEEVAIAEDHEWTNYYRQNYSETR